MGTSCIDVCNEVCSRLESLGFDLGDDEDHGPILAALNQCEVMRGGFYLIQAVDDLEPVDHGPFATEWERIQTARKIRHERGPEDGLYCLDFTDGKLVVYSIGGAASTVGHRCKVCGDLVDGDDDSEVRNHMAWHHAGAYSMSIEQLRESLEALE